MNTSVYFSEKDMDDIWWGQITKANHFIQTVASAILDHDSILINLPERTPWKQTFYDRVEGILRQGDSNYNLTFQDCPAGEAGEFLLEKYCKEDKRNSYRYGMSYAEFLAKSDDIVLNSRYVWVKNVTDEKLNEWVDFILEYNKNLRKNASSAVFILETQTETTMAKKLKGIKHLSFDDSISFYDKYSFCIMASTEIDIKTTIRPYVAEIVSSVCRDDIELCATCMQHWKDFVNEPYETLMQIVQSEEHGNATNFAADYSPELVDARTWEAQIKLLFPIVERYRTRTVKKYCQYIEKALPIETAYGEIINDPLGVELGTFSRLVKEKSISLSSKENAQLDSFKKVRNYLAHMKTLDFKMVEWVLSQRI